MPSATDRQPDDRHDEEADHCAGDSQPGSPLGRRRPQPGAWARRNRRPFPPPPGRSSVRKAVAPTVPSPGQPVGEPAPPGEDESWTPAEPPCPRSRRPSRSASRGTRPVTARNLSCPRCVTAQLSAARPLVARQCGPARRFRGNAVGVGQHCLVGGSDRREAVQAGRGSVWATSPIDPGCQGGQLNDRGRAVRPFALGARCGYTHRSDGKRCGDAAFGCRRMASATAAPATPAQSVASDAGCAWLAACGRGACGTGTRHCRPARCASGGSG